MYRKIILFLCIDHFNRFELAYQYTGITDLTTTFCIEWSIVEYNLIQCLVLLFDLAITQDLCLAFEQIITHELTFTLFQRDPVACLDSGGVTGTLFLLLHSLIEGLDIGFHAVLTKNQFRQVQRESVGII